MEQTPSTERVIPIEIIGQVSDVSEDEIDIDKFVKNISSNININNSPKSENENSSSNRGSLIITHEDGSTEENECTVTCLGITSDSGSNQGLQIEEISQDTFKDKLADEKLKVVISDMSQLIILEADEVTDPSFVSTPEVEESSQAYEISIYDDIKMYDIDYEKEGSSTPLSTTPATTYKITQEEHDDKIQDQKEENSKQQNLVDTVDSLNANCNTKQGEHFDITFDLTENMKNPDNAQTQTLACDLSLTVRKTMNSVEETGTMVMVEGQCETPSEEEGKQPTNNNRKSSNEECKLLESKESEPTAVAESGSVESKDIEILDIQINLDVEGSSEYKNTNNISKQNSKESDRSEQISKSAEPINKDDLNLESKSQKTSLDGAKDKAKLPLKKVIAETVRIIPITLPDGRFIESGILSDHSVKQMEYNNSQLPDIGHEDKDSSNRDNVIHDRNNTARTIAILIESPENLSTSRQESEKDEEAKDANTVEDKEEGPHNNNSDNIMDNFNLITKSSQSTKKLSETKSMQACTGQVNQRVESKDISNTIIDNFETKDLQHAQNRINIQLPAEDKLIKDKQEHSQDEIDKESIQTDPVKNRTIIKEKPAASNIMAELEVKTINPLSDDCAILDKNKQTEATQQGNTRSDVSSRQLIKDVEDERESNVPIVIQTVGEGESENINENKTTNSQLIHNGKDTKEKSNTQMNKSISNQILKVSSGKTQNKNNNEQIQRGQISGGLSAQNKKQNADDKNTTSKEPVKGRSVSIELTDSSVSTCELNNTFRHTGMEDYTENKLHPERTKKENTSSSKLYKQSSEEKLVDNKQVRNIPIQIQTNIQGESENIQKNESTDNNQTIISNVSNDECQKSGYIGKKNKIREDSSLEARYETDENPPINFAPASPTSPIMRTVPIQIVGCTSAELEDPGSNIKAETKSNISNQTQRQIPIQRVLEKETENITQLSETSQDQKSESLIVEDTNSGKQTIQNIKQQTLPRYQQQGSISVPIEIQLPDETIDIQTTKEAHIEQETQNTQRKISQSTLLNRTKPNFQPGKDRCMNPSSLQPTLPVPTSKPPVVERTIPILRQSLSDSGEGMTRQQTSTRQRNRSEQSTRGDILQKVHQELEEARAKFTAQAKSLSSGVENIPTPVYGKNDPRSRSVESEQRNQGESTKDGKPRNLFKRERSIQDIDKDIETIWRELQELDKPNIESEVSGRRSSRIFNRSQTPPLEQVLVTPFWRTPTPTPPSSQSVRASLSNPNIHNANTEHQQTIQQTTSPHTIWDKQNAQEPINDATPSGQLSSSLDSKPQNFPKKASTHFSFPPKAETKPGAIKPSYVSHSPKSGHFTVRNIPIEKAKANAPKTEVQLHKRNELQKESMKIKQFDEGSRAFKSEESQKSCLKSEASTFTIQKNRQSPINVKFSNKRKSAENAPKTSEGSSEADPPFEWVDFRKADGEIVKGTILPPLHREDDVIISREVPIINVLLDDALYEETNPQDRNKKPIIIGKETKIQCPIAPDNRDQKDNPSSETFNACDAGTQTEKFEKKGGCHIM